METSGALSLPSCGWIGLERIGRNPPGCVLRLVQRYAVDKVVRKLNVRQLRSNDAVLERRSAGLKIRCSCKRSGALESETLQASIDEALILKETAESVAPCLSGRCIYLVGMMGSGKTTVGKILAEALGYSFCDSDKLVEQDVGGISVAQIFKEYNEIFFRDNETKVLHELSSMSQLVVATGGGAVIRPVNWRHMKKGITVWLDVPLEALARRIAAVGTASRPLLDQDSGDPYTKAFMHLSALSKERGEAYTNADARVSLPYIAAKQGQGDVNTLTPAAIAIEALIRIEEFLKKSKLEEVRVSRDEA